MYIIEWLLSVLILAKLRIVMLNSWSTDTVHMLDL
jgi:hypothetical protein